MTSVLSWSWRAGCVMFYLFYTLFNEEPPFYKILWVRRHHFISYLREEEPFYWVNLGVVGGVFFLFMPKTMLEVGWNVISWSMLYLEGWSSRLSYFIGLALCITAHIFYFCCVKLDDYINKINKLSLDIDINNWMKLFGSFKYESCLLIYMYSLRMTLLYYIPYWKKHSLNFTFTNFLIVKMYTVYFVSTDEWHLKYSEKHAPIPGLEPTPQMIRTTDWRHYNWATEAYY